MFREKEKEILDSIIGEGRYDRRIRPSGVNNTEGKGKTCPIFICSYLNAFWIPISSSFGEGACVNVHLLIKNIFKKKILI